MGKPAYGNIDLLSYLESTQPHEVYRVQEAIDPRECEHAGFEEALRERGKRPWVIFEQLLRADGGKWRGLFSMRRANGRIHRFRYASITNRNQRSMFSMKWSGTISRPRKLRFLVLIVFSFLLISSSLTWAADNIIIGMAGMNFSFLPFQIATEKRFYEKYDLSVKPVLMRAQAAIPALVSGDVDYDTHFGSLVRGAVSGLPLRVVFSTAENQMFSLVVQPEIKTVENLKGKVIAISSFGGTQHLVTAATLRAVGIDPDRDVKMINVGNETIRVEHLRSKQIQAAMINPPISVMMKKEGFRLLLHAADYVDLPLTGLGATTKKLKENPEQVKRVLRALNESLQFIRSNRKETIAIFARWLKLDTDIAADTYDVAVRVLSIDGSASDKAIIASIEEAKDAGKIKGNFTPKDVTDFSPLRSILAEAKQKK